MQQYPIRFGRDSRKEHGTHAPAGSAQRSVGVFLRATVLALCGGIICVAFLAYSVAPKETPKEPQSVQVMAGVSDCASDRDGTVPVISGHNDGSLWAYIEGVIRGIIGDAGD